MNYTYCERLMWVAIAPAAFRYLARQELGWDISALKQLSKQIYRQMVSRTPDIGSMMENPLRVCLTGGILWLSIYKAAEEKMSEKCFEGMVSASMRSTLVVTAFRGKAKTAFTLKAQYKRAATASLADADRNPFQWNAEVIFGRDAEEYTILLPPVRSVCPGPTGGPSSSGSLSMRSGHDVRRLDGWAALPYQNAGCRR